MMLKLCKNYDVLMLRPDMLNERVVKHIRVFTVKVPSD